MILVAPDFMLNLTKRPLTLHSYNIAWKDNGEESLILDESLCSLLLAREKTFATVGSAFKKMLATPTCIHTAASIRYE